MHDKGAECSGSAEVRRASRARDEVRGQIATGDRMYARTCLE
jgi:hypothetical protein